MKRPQVVLAISALNFVILGLAALAINAAAQAPELPQPQIQAARKNWQSAAHSSQLPHWEDVALSPTKRTVKEEPIIEEPQPDVEPTDAELRAELEARFASEVKLLRIIYAEGRPEMCFAKVRVGSREVVLAPHSAFYATVAETLVKMPPAWLADVHVKDIRANGVTINAPSRKPEKRFEITLTIKESSLISVGPHREVEPGRDSVPLPGNDRSPEPRNENLPAEKTKTTQDADGGYRLGTEDTQSKEALEAAASCLRVVVDERGEPIGMQIPEDVKDDNLLLRCGGRRGDIIKSVNGKPVKTLADARRTVREEYDAGKREFEIGFERDGAPQRQIIRAPK